MGFVIIGLIVVGVIAFVGGGHTIDGMAKDTRVTSDKMTQEMNESK